MSALWVRMPLAKVKSNPSNPRIIKDDKFRKLVQSIREFPEMLELRPIVVDADGVVLGGNMRLRAAKDAGLTEVPVIRADHLTAEQQREFVVKDNVGFGDWDWEALANEWDRGQLEAWGMDVPAAEVALTAGLTDPDDVPETPKEPITKVGNRIVLGRHTLVCGDSTDAGVWDKLLQGRQIGMIWTDPPYGVNIGGVNAHLKKYGKANATRESHEIKNDDISETSLEQLLQGSFSCAWSHCRAGGAWYVASPPGPLQQVFGVVFAALKLWRQTLIWHKDQFVLGRSDYHYQHEPVLYGWKEGEPQHEPILYGWKEGQAHTWNSDRKQSTVLEFPRPKRNAEHPTMKPVELVQYCIRNSSNADDLVADPFGGSGTTLIASETLGRAAALIELDPRYCDVIVRRWEEFTGQKAIRPAS